MERLLERLSLLGFAVTLVLSLYIFLKVQVLQSFPFSYAGAYGNQVLLFLTYTQTMEVSGPLSFSAFAVWSCSRERFPQSLASVARGIARSLLLFGGLTAAIVYAETHLVWGELWYGVHVWPSLPGGGGYPWGDEQVAYNLCFIKEGSYTPQVPNCSFLNYNWLLGLAVSAFLVGLVIELYFRSNPSGVPPPARQPIRLLATGTVTGEVPNVLGMGEAFRQS